MEPPLKPSSSPTPSPPLPASLCSPLLVPPTTELLELRQHHPHLSNHQRRLRGSRTPPRSDSRVARYLGLRARLLIDVCSVSLDDTNTSETISGRSHALGTRCGSFDVWNPIQHPLPTVRGQTCPLPGRSRDRQHSPYTAVATQRAFEDRFKDPIYLLRIEPRYERPRITSRLRLVGERQRGEVAASFPSTPYRTQECVGFSSRRTRPPKLDVHNVCFPAGQPPTPSLIAEYDPPYKVMLTKARLCTLIVPP